MIELSMVQVALAVVPVSMAVLIYGSMVNDWRSVLWATLRMFVQLIAIGYCLTAIFDLNRPGWVLLVVLVMLAGAGWIALRPVRKYQLAYWPIFVAIAATSVFNLTWIIAFVIRPQPWFEPSVLIPMAGMVFANAMNCTSLCVERFQAELANAVTPAEATRKAMTAAMIPQINSLMAVGLVSLPGMMTGQILSGVSPLIAVRYQIVIMSMILSNGALCSFLYLKLQRYARTK